MFRTTDAREDAEPVSTELTAYDAWKLASPEDRRTPPMRNEFRDSISRLEKLAFMRNESEVHAFDIRVSETSTDSARFEVALEFDVACAFAGTLPDVFAIRLRQEVERLIKRVKGPSE